MREEGAGAGEIADACRLRPSGPRRSRATVRIHNDARTYGPTAPKGTMVNAPDRHKGVTGSPHRCQPHVVPMTGDCALPHRATAEITTRRNVVTRLLVCRSRFFNLTAVDHQCRGRCTATQPDAAHHGESQHPAEWRGILSGAGHSKKGARAPTVTAMPVQRTTACYYRPQ